MVDYLQGTLYIVEIVVGIGLLIFIHEFGHFLMAKRNKVKVEAFSLGMGPIVWKWMWGGTEYRISAIPLGGYVKMAGENVGDVKTGAADELPSKTVWQRLQIFSAGALMNLLIAFPISVLAFILGRAEYFRIVSVPGHPETIAGMRPGDEVLEVDGLPIESLDQYRREMVRRSEGAEVPVKVRRDGTELTLRVKQGGSERHAWTRPVETTIYEVRKDSPAWNAGLRSGDIVRSIDGKAMIRGQDLALLLLDSPEKTLSLVVGRVEDKTSNDIPVKLTVPPAQVYTWPEDAKMAEPVVEEAVPSGPADVRLDGKPFLMKGDVITKINDRTIRSWQDLKDAVEASPGIALKITRERDRVATTVEIIPTYSERGTGQLGIKQLSTPRVVEVTEDSHYYKQGLRSGDVILGIENSKGELATGAIGVRDLFGERGDKKSIQIRILRGSERMNLAIAAKEEKKGDLVALGLLEPGKPFLAANTFVRYWKFGAAVKDGLWEPVDITVLTFQILKKLFSGQESTKGLAGPLGIFQASYHHAKMGLGNFLWLLVLITVNLGIFNLLPVPVLDGGHIVLLAIEKVRGRPPSARFVEKFQLVGLVLLLALIVYVTFNDISRL